MVAARGLRYDSAVRFNAVLFDLDGTLVDSHREITLALMRALDDFDLPLSFAEAAPMVDGQGLEYIWEERLFTRLGAPARARGYRAFAETYRDHYMAKLGHATALYPDVEVVLRRLHSLSPRPKLAVVSNKSAASVPALVGLFGMSRYFDAMLGAGGTTHAPKPSPALLLHTAELLGVAPAACVMVGDTELDVRAGRLAGMCTVALTHGMGSPDELASADHVVHSFAALLPLLASA